MSVLNDKPAALWSLNAKPKNNLHANSKDGSSVVNWFKICKELSAKAEAQHFTKIKTAIFVSRVCPWPDCVTIIVHYGFNL